MSDINAQTSDGYHTFAELYDHRALLFIALAATCGCPVWYSFWHHDGTSHEGYFLAGIEFMHGTITYHLERKHMRTIQKIPGVVARIRAPKWDGHTSEDVLERLQAFIELESLPREDNP